MRCFAIAVVLVGCSSEPEGSLTGASCPDVDPPTYASFGQQFMTAYCIDCHSENLRGDDREGAPPTIDFDTQSLLRQHTSRIDKQAAFGPMAQNRLMPPADGGPKPSDAERTRLGEYIACEVAR
ncbi:MAG TPA: c-type cytochrome [Kofleriaceae bacterium]